MPGDISRRTFNARKHYVGVGYQQGRVTTDADPNEQFALDLYRTQIEAIDVIGACGAPIGADGFEIGVTPDGRDLTISSGRMYVDGLLCESDSTAIPVTFTENADRVSVPTLIVDEEQFETGQWVEIGAVGIAGTRLVQIVSVDDETQTLTLGDEVADFQGGSAAFLRRVTTYLTQPDYAAPEFSTSVTSPPLSPPAISDVLDLDAGTYLVFLKAWLSELNYLQDPSIREVALGGPDTATRIKTTWQVRLLRVIPLEGQEVDCNTEFSEWNLETTPPNGRMNARTVEPEEDDNPCLLPPSAGYTRLENELYRVEIQRAGNRAAATFKWARFNASVETTISNIDNTVVEVAEPGKDDVLTFAANQWVEIVDAESELNFSPRALVQIDSVDKGKRQITMTSSLTEFEGRRGLRLRRWDNPASATSDGIPLGAGWTDLEGGIQVQFSNGFYKSGDFWLIPARTVTGSIEWPRSNPETPVAQPPVGVSRHFCRLALLQVDEAGTITPRSDCRRLFPPLIDLGRTETVMRVTQVTARGAQGNAVPLANDTEVVITSIAGGIEVEFDRQVAAASVDRPTAFLTAEVPFSGNAVIAANGTPDHYIPFVMPASVSVNNQTMTILLSQAAQRLLASLPAPAAPDRGILARLTLKGNFIWASRNQNIFLDGEAFGRRISGIPSTLLRLPSGDGRRGGDFEMWFWLRQPAPVGTFRLAASTGVPPMARSEGLTELIADLVLTGIEGAPTASGSPVPVYNITLITNTNLTSPSIGSIADVVLLMDDPVTLNTNTDPVLGAGPAAVDFRNGAARNVYFALRVSNNTVVFQGVPIDPPAAGQQRTLRFKNTRADANALGVSSSLVPTQIIIFVSLSAASGQLPIPIENPQQIGGFVSVGATTSVRRADGRTGVFSFSVSQGVNPELARDERFRGASINVSLAFTEGFATSFKPRKDGTVQLAKPVGMSEEAGFDNEGAGALPVTGPALPNIGDVLCGTRFQAEFTNVPGTVRLFVTTRDIPEGNVRRARAVFAPLGAPLPSEDPLQPGPEAEGIPIIQVATVNGAAIVQWEWIDRSLESRATINTIRFGVVLAALPGEAASTPAVGSASVRLSIAPVSSDRRPQGQPVPRFISTGQSVPLFTITIDQTNLLFPFVTGGGGFDTGTVFTRPGRIVNR
jgi:hypothetical protein